jgi:uncharacterized protein (TIGR04255 family)
MSKRQPVKLKKEPLIEAVCQLRVASKVALNTFFPGLLLAKHPEEVTDIQQLPTAILPEQLRATQPELAYAPLVQLKFKGVVILVGERSVTVSNPAPYLGWARFKALIINVFTDLLDAKLITVIERFSLKYTNVIKPTDKVPSLGNLDWAVNVGKLSLNMPATAMRTETITHGLTTIINITGAVIVQAGEQTPVEGSLIDVDTIFLGPSLAADAFAASMADELDRVRSTNKEVFFECLTDEAINALEPIYE